MKTTTMIAVVALIFWAVLFHFHAPHIDPPSGWKIQTCGTMKYRWVDRDGYACRRRFLTRFGAVQGAWSFKRLDDKQPKPTEECVWKDVP